MFEIDPTIASREIGGLPLWDGSRRFATWWLSQIAADGTPVAQDKASQIPCDLAVSTLICEVRPWATVICRSSGDLINRALGISLAGRDMLALVAPTQRTERLTRYAKVSAGGVLVGYRSMVTSGGAKPRLQELMLPCPDRQIEPLEKGAALTVSFIDSTAVARDTHVLVSQGALNVADEPTFIDLRGSLSAAACAGARTNNSLPVGVLASHGGAFR